MAAIFAFRCATCDKLHEGSPSFAFFQPDYYCQLSDEEKAASQIDEDRCKVVVEEGEYYFIRALLEIPIIGVGEPFLWGIWMSVSKKSFFHYLEVTGDPEEGDGFFGYVANEISVYPKSLSLRADVYLQPDKLRPLVLIQPEHGQDKHPLFIDQQEGISVTRAVELAEANIHR